MLTRFKTFVATGLATAGRLYAGDMNAIQDAVAAQSDYAQRVDAATFGLGEAGLALLHYGTLEGRLSGSLRLDGILRALGGLWGAQFTTAARDALTASVGLTPYGLIIFNTTTNRYEWNKGNDTVRNWQPLSGVSVNKNGGGSPYSEGGINLIEGAGITIGVADNPGSGYVDITISAPAATVAGTVPIGGIVEYGGTADPANFLLCDGRSLLRAGTYNALFVAIQTVFGSADGTHFNIPDYRNRMGAGVGSNVALGANEGLIASLRSPQHSHAINNEVANTSDGVLGGFHIAPGHSPGGSYTSLQAGSSPTQEAPAYLGVNKAIRYQ